MRPNLYRYPWLSATWQKVKRQDGIAIGPILFIIAILGLLASVIASNMGTMANTGTIDRIAADIPSQANLIRSKISECYAKYGTDRNFDGYPPSGGTAIDTAYVSLGSQGLTCVGDSVGLGTSAIISLWNGPRPTTLPPPTQGFGDWQYINTNASGLGGSATGGRCIYISPTLSNPNTVPGIVQGLTKAASKFSSQTTCNNSLINCTAPVIYDPNSASQKFIMWITLPTGAPDSHCLP
jgi:hypothetical protein